MVPSIRPATAADIPLLHDLAHHIWPEAYGSLLSQQQIAYMLNLMYAPPAIAAGMANGTHWAIIEGAIPCGFVAWSPADTDLTTLHLDKLYLRAEYRGLGLADLALAQVIGAARSSGRLRIRLRVNRGNARAITAYRKRGFITVAEACTAIGNGFVMDDHIMERQISE